MTERRGRGSRGARGAAAQLVREHTDGGEAWSRGGVVDRGGRDEVEDERGDSDHHSPLLELLRGHGALGRVYAPPISGWGSGGDEFGRSPCGYGELDAGDGRLPGTRGSGRRTLRGIGWWCVLGGSRGAHL